HCDVRPAPQPPPAEMAREAVGALLEGVVRRRLDAEDHRGCSGPRVRLRLEYLVQESERLSASRRCGAGDRRLVGGEGAGSWTRRHGQSRSHREPSDGRGLERDRAVALHRYPRRLSRKASSGDPTSEAFEVTARVRRKPAELAIVEGCTSSSVCAPTSVWGGLAHSAGIRRRRFPSTFQATGKTRCPAKPERSGVYPLQHPVCFTGP